MCISNKLQGGAGDAVFSDARKSGQSRPLCFAVLLVGLGEVYLKGETNTLRMLAACGIFGKK